MRYFYDTEFLESGPEHPIELISIGIVAEDGRELYLVNRDAPWGKIKKNGWLMANVVPQLPQPHGDWRNHMPKRWLIDLNSPYVRSREAIADRVATFLLGNDLETYADLELWADYGAYDHVALCQLFGRMIDLPDGMPMFTHDLQQALRAAGNPSMPQQASGTHNALEDARHLRACFQALQGSPR
ncbi:3'-5' exoribonuclease domain-containing protein [Actinoplanes siamensis]|uniref:3'-5' exoribonuclease n=1 Tax=Actinoplanes siamensis TaxID=1223317 RepID=A0A919TNY8_9ACTN|nr:3'-5' exoribonuclease [Actinoplanes siamensis]GIF08648.1 3'-5' exoribonuclease [Actinoplanes siamensis]